MKDTTAKSKSRTICQFHHEVMEGDFIVAKDGMKQILGIGIAEKRSGKVTFYDKKRGFERTENHGNCYPNFLNVRWCKDSELVFPEEVFGRHRFIELEKGFRRKEAVGKYLPVIRNRIEELTKANI